MDVDTLGMSEPLCQIPAPLVAFLSPPPLPTEFLMGLVQERLSAAEAGSLLPSTLPSVGPSGSLSWIILIFRTGR